MADVALWVASAPLEEVALVAKLCAKRTGQQAPVSTGHQVAPVLTGPGLSPSASADPMGYPYAVSDWAAEAAAVYGPPASAGAWGLPQGRLSETAVTAHAPKVPVGFYQPQGVKPPPGESGSGYTRLPNGKLVRNQKPKARSLQETQAKNWQERAQSALRDYVTGHFQRPPKEVQEKPPKGDGTYDGLVADLEWAKAYRLLVHQALEKGTSPEGVDEFRRRVQRPAVVGGKVVRPATPEGGTAESSAQAAERPSGNQKGIIPILPSGSRVTRKH